MTAVTSPAHIETRLLPVISHHGKPGEEVRPLFFLKAFGMEALPARLISFASCNFSCPYCKRATAISREAVHVSLDELKAVIETAKANGETIRFSGGDPSVFPEETLLLAQHARKLGVPVSIAHNGSSIPFVKRLIPLLHSAAIDLKAPPWLLHRVAGIKPGLVPLMFARSLRIQRMLSRSGVLLDVRTPVFSSTTLADMIFLAGRISRNHLPKTFWTWRVYEDTGSPAFRPPRVPDVLEMVREVKARFPELRIGVRTKWDPSGFLYFL